MTGRELPARRTAVGPLPARPAIDEGQRRESRWSPVRRRPVHALAALVLVAIVALALAAPILPLADPGETALLDRLEGPLRRGNDGTLHAAGTDQLGRDVLARTVHGARVTLAVASIAALASGLLGAALGIVAGYRRGIADHLVMRIVDFQVAFPALVLAIFLLYLVGTSITNLVILLVAFSWAGVARVARAETLRVRSAPFVEGAHAVGASGLRIVLRHLLPHLLPVLSVVAVFDFAGVMLAESSLSFLGLGVQPPGSSWGLMLAQSREYVYTGGWWLFVTPGLALFMATLAANLSARWLQELTRLRD